MSPIRAEPQLSVLHVDPERGFSGGEVQVLGLMAGLARAGHRQWLAGHPGGPALAAARELGVETLPIPMRGDLAPLAVWRLARALRRLRPDVLHLHTGRATWIGSLGGRLAGHPGRVLVSTRRMDRPVRRNARNRWIYGSALDATAAISPAVRECLVAGGVPEERIELIWSSVDPERLRPSRPRAELRQTFGLDADERLILCAGGLVERKGFDVALEAFAQLGRAAAGARLWIAGEGPQRAALEERIATLPDARAVRLLGRRGDVPDLLAAADVFCMPSRAEGLGVAALEAMACGVPVAAAAVGGLGEAIVDGEQGLLCPADDPAALTESMRRLLGSAELRARMGASGRQRVAEVFHVERMVAAYRELYRRLHAERA